LRSCGSQARKLRAERLEPLHLYFARVPVSDIQVRSINASALWQSSAEMP
jgi:hypothetical protein